MTTAVYDPADDIIYLNPQTDLRTSGDLGIERHESVHFLGGRGATIDAFQRRLEPGVGARWLDYFSAFEEGIAKMVAQDSAPRGVAPTAGASAPPSSTTTSGGGTTTVTVATTGAYLSEVAWMRAVMGSSPRNRALILGAYFSGAVPESVFSLLIDRRRFGDPPRH